MRSLRLLLYPQRVNLLRLNEIRHTRDKKEKRRLMALLPAYALAGLMLPAYGTMLAYGLYTADASDVLILYTCALSAVLALVVSIVRGYTVLFGRRDADLVGALPFSQGMVALSRLVPMYLSALLSTLLLMAPACVLYMLAAGVTAGTLVKLLLIILCTPMLPTALGVAGSAAIAWVGVRFRHKNLLIVLLGVLATAGIVVAAQILPMKVAQSGAQLYTLVDAIKAPLTALYPPALWANEAMQPQGVWQLVLFVLVNALPLAAAVGVLGRTYYALHDAVMVVKRTRRREKSADSRSPLRALVQKELRGLLGRPMYLMNSCISMWLTPVILFAVALFMPDARQMLQSQPALLALIRRMAPVILAAFLSMTSSTAVAVSLEGPAAWLMCTCPVAPEIIYRSKVITFLIVALPTIPLSVIGALLLIPLSVGEIAATVLLSAALCLWMGVSGLRWDVRFKRFTYKNEIDMIKQSAQVFLTMLTGFVTLAVCGAAVYFSGGYYVLAAIGCAAVLAVLSWALFAPLAKRPLYVID